ncbi:hypothetical protein Mapa_011650 [Marchantia paleacea]|nr:hypothetical protein Mapa_011650 [Marchantia paleacea]
MSTTSASIMLSVFELFSYFLIQGATFVLNAVNGNVYQGHWIDDLKHGLGVFYYKDKESKYEGLWKDDVPVCGTYNRNVKFDDDEDKLPLPMLEMANFQTLVGDLISDAWNAPPQSTL